MVLGCNMCWIISWLGIVASYSLDQDVEKQQEWSFRTCFLWWARKQLCILPKMSNYSFETRLFRLWPKPVPAAKKTEKVKRQDVHLKYFPSVRNSKSLLWWNHNRFNPFCVALSHTVIERSPFIGWENPCYMLLCNLRPGSMGQMSFS